MWSAEEVGNECGNGIRDGTRKGQGQSYARVQRCGKNVEGVEWRAWSVVDELWKMAA